MNKVRVLVVDDQTELANEISAVLATDPTLQVVGTACDGFDALGKIPATKPDVVLMDIRMPNMNGVVATSRIKKKYPDVKVLILTTFDDSDYLLNANNNGASGYLLKDIGGDALIAAIKMRTLEIQYCLRKLPGVLRRRQGILRRIEKSV